jgi:osmotically-inducible protein OsmY
MPTTKHENVTHTDAGIARDIRRRMKADIEVPDDRIEVRISEGRVTIEGSVTRESQKDAAEACARTAPGVREIANKIEVVPAATPLEG